MRLVIVVLVLLTLYLQYGLWYTRGGKHDVEKLKTSVAEQKEEIARLKERNRSLSAEVMDLKQGLEAIEERARSEMGMIKNGEVFFRITDPNHESDLPAVGGAAARGSELPLEPPLDPLTPGDGMHGDGVDSPPIAGDAPVSVKPMVKALAKAAAASQASGAKPPAAGKSGSAKPAPASKPAAGTRAGSTTKPATSAVTKRPPAPKPNGTTAAKSAAKSTAPTPAKGSAPTVAKPRPVSPSTTSKAVTPSTTPRPATKPAPAPVQPQRKPVVSE